MEFRSVGLGVRGPQDVHLVSLGNLVSLEPGLRTLVGEPVVNGHGEGARDAEGKKKERDLWGADPHRPSSLKREK